MKVKHIKVLFVIYFLCICHSGSFPYYPMSTMLTLAQYRCTCWSDIGSHHWPKPFLVVDATPDSIAHGTSVSPTLAANVGPTAFWLEEAMLAQLGQATGKNSIQCITSANQHGVMLLLFNRRQVIERLWEDLS